MAGVNRVILLGNLGADPDIRTFENGTKVARLRVATTETYKDKNGQRHENTEWHTVNLWRGLADVAERFLRKGSTVYVEGKIRSRQYQDRDGNDKMSFEIEADNMTMVGKRSDDQGGGNPGGGSNYQQSRPQSQGAPQNTRGNDPIRQLEEGDEDDLPF